MTTTPTPNPLANFREVGAAGLQAGRSRIVYRSNTEAVDAAAYPVLFDAVIDLRRDDEIALLPHPLAATTGYRSVPLFDPTTDAESTDPAAPLEAQYVDWLSRHRVAIAAVFRALADTRGNVLVCCAAGKDRTGVVSAILARMWGTDLDRIGADSAASGTVLQERFAAELRASDDLDRTRRMQRCVPEIITTVVADIEGRYGSVDKYLASIGLTAAEVAALR